MAWPLDEIIVVPINVNELADETDILLNTVLRYDERWQRWSCIIVFLSLESCFKTVGRLRRMNFSVLVKINWFTKCRLLDSNTEVNMAKAQRVAFVLIADSLSRVIL